MNISMKHAGLCTTRLLHLCLLLRRCAAVLSECASICSHDVELSAVHILFREKSLKHRCSRTKAKLSQNYMPLVRFQCCAAHCSAGAFQISATCVPYCIELDSTSSLLWQALQHRRHFCQTAVAASIYPTSQKTSRTGPSVCDSRHTANI